MTEEFCQALINNDRATIKALVEAMITQQYLLPNDYSSLEHIKQWIEQQDCVRSVDISIDLLDTEPPIQEFIIHLKSEADRSNNIRTIGIILAPDKLQCD